MSWAMAFNVRDISPDILSLPSTPLKPHGVEFSVSPAKRPRRATPARHSIRLQTKPETAESVTTMSAAQLLNPGKSIVVNSPRKSGERNGAGSHSPGRVRPTVEAEPRKENDKVDRAPKRKEVFRTDRSRTKRRQKSTPSVSSAVAESVEIDNAGTPWIMSSPPKRPKGRPWNHLEHPNKVPLLSSSPKRPHRRSRMNSFDQGTERSQRLSLARDQLDGAIRDAVGQEQEADEDGGESEELQGDEEEFDHVDLETIDEEEAKEEKHGSTFRPGELTITENEAGDFSMISVQSLESRKELHNSLFGAARNASEDQPSVNANYLPSSPPASENTAAGRSQVSARATQAKQVLRQIPSPAQQQKQQRMTSGIVDRSVVEQGIKSRSPQRANVIQTTAPSASYDAMSWQPTGRARIEPSIRAQQRRQRQEQRQQRRQQSYQPSLGNLHRQDSSTLQSTSADGDSSLHHKDRTKNHRRDRREERRAARRAREMKADAEADKIRDVNGKETEMIPSALGIEHDEDLWVEEASREVQEIDQPKLQQQRLQEHMDQQGQSQEGTNKGVEPKLFVDEVYPPKRGKIPRTWRRSSGVDFLYSDSPEHLHPPLLPMKSRSPLTSTKPTDAHSKISKGVLEGKGNDEGDSTDEDRRGGVLTPESNEEVVNSKDELEYNLKRNQTSSSKDVRMVVDTDADFTLPEAEATTLLHQQTASTRALSPTLQQQMSDHLLRRKKSADHITLLNSDGDGRGVFSQAQQRSHPPQTRPDPRRSRRTGKAMDLNELLGLSSSSPVLKRPRLSDAARAAIDSLNIKAAGLVEEKTSTKTELPREYASVTKAHSLGNDSTEGAQTGVETVHKRELEFVSRKSKRRSGYVHQSPEAEAEGLSEEQETSNQRHNPNDVSHSYEEQLNKESPKKIRVKLGESFTENSTLLRPTRVYSPLFRTTVTNLERQQLPSQDHHVSVEYCDTSLDNSDNKSITPSESVSAVAVALQSHNLDQRNEAQLHKPGLLARIFGPSFLRSFMAEQSRPQAQLNSTPRTFPVPLLPMESLQQPYPASHRARLRSRYGVLPSTHPWTLAHMQTLHRMHNSVYGGKKDSIVIPPRPLSDYLAPVLGDFLGEPYPGQKEPRENEEVEVVTNEDAWIVAAFFQLLVSASVCGAMERGEVEVLGDGFAKGMRERGDGSKPLGLEREFGEEAEEGEEIGVEFTFECLGRCVEVQMEWEEGHQEE